MQKIIHNAWHHASDAPFIRAEILRHDVHPEGLNVDRVRFKAAGVLPLDAEVGHIVSLLHGRGRLRSDDGKSPPLFLEAGCHVYLPPHEKAAFDAEADTELIQISSPSAAQTRGRCLLVRDETFLAACAVKNRSLRWILTPQYLSRRIFLHHDQVLLSKSLRPVSWFRTTMFDVAGLPPNEEGQSVFKMSYNSRTEFNLCYDVKGDASVRMARHPYAKSNQTWDIWSALDGDSSYHLNESAEGPEAERVTDGKSKAASLLRNKHEVRIIEGWVSLFCMFDPAPIGMERHVPGEYSDYEPLEQVASRPGFASYQNDLALFDTMVDRLSLAKAMGELEKFRASPEWDLYLRGREAQKSVGRNLHSHLAQEGGGREKIIERWQTVDCELRNQARPKDKGLPNAVCQAG